MPSKNYNRYVLGLLTAIYTLSFVDRALVALFLEQIRAELSLSDTQLGFLTGIAFGLFYATLGLPLARWSDRGNRAAISSIAIGVWSITVMSCAFVTNFVQLMFARIAAGVGEAGAMPPTYSLLGDYFTDGAARMKAMAVYMLASPLSSFVGFIIGGWVSSIVGWRMTFFVMGIPAVFLALLAWLTIVEPRKRVQGIAVQSAPHLPLRLVLATIWNRRSLRHISFGIILLGTMGLGFAPWYAAFLSRTHHMTPDELGLWLGLIFGVGGAAGTLLGGFLGARFFATDEVAQLRTSAIALGLLTPFFFAFLLVPSKVAALLIFLPLNMTWTIFLGPTYALLQRLVDDRMRATLISVIMLVSNLVGLGLGPQLVGIASDALRPEYGEDSLRYAMLSASLLAAWAALHFWRGSKHVMADLAALPSEAPIEGAALNPGARTT